MAREHKEEFKKLAQNIKKIRKQKNLTQDQLAEKAKISKSYISKIEAENCDKGISLDTLFTIAKALEIEVKEFF